MSYGGIVSIEYRVDGKAITFRVGCVYLDVGVGRPQRVLIERFFPGPDASCRILSNGTHNRAQQHDARARIGLSNLRLLSPLEQLAQAGAEA